MRNLGSFPQRSRLVGPVARSVEEMKHSIVDPSEVSLSTLPSDVEAEKPLNIGIVGFDEFGQQLAQKLAKKHKVACLDKGNKVRIVLMLRLNLWRFHSLFLTIAPHFSSNPIFFRLKQRKLSV